jgi:NAD-dependent DNA ligase
MTRDEAANQVKELGAEIDTEINKRTDYVIIGQGTAP